MTDSSYRIGVRRADDPTSFRWLDEGETLVLADVATWYEEEPVRWRLALPDELHRTVLRFARSDDKLFMNVIEGPVWHGGFGRPLAESNEMGRGRTVRLVQNDRIYLSDRGEERLTLVVSLTEWRARVEVGGPKIKATDADAPNLPPAGEWDHQEPEIAVIGTDEAPRGWYRRQKKRYRDARKKYWLPLRRRMATGRYWLMQAQSLQKLVMSALAIVLMVLALVMGLRLLNTQKSHEAGGGRTLETEQTERLEDFLPGTPLAALDRRLEAAEDPAAQLLVRLLAPVEPDQILDQRYDPMLGSAEQYNWVRILQPYLARLPQGPPPGDQEGYGELRPLKRRWCEGRAPLRVLHSKLAQQSSVVEGAPLFAYVPLVRSAYCPMYLDPDGRRGPGGLREGLVSPQLGGHRAMLRGLAGGRLPAGEPLWFLDRRWSRSFWFLCSEEALLRYAGWIRTGEEGTPDPAAEPLPPEVQAAAAERLRGEIVGIGVDPADDRTRIDAAADRAQRQLTGWVQEYDGPRHDAQPDLDAYLLALWRYDQGDAVPRLLDAIQKERALEPSEITFWGASRYAQAQGWDVERTEFPLWVLSWYLTLEPHLESWGCD